MLVNIEWPWLFKYIAIIMFIFAVFYKFIPENKMKNIISKFYLDRFYLILYIMVTMMALLVHEIRVDLEVILLYAMYAVIVVYNMDETKEESLFQIVYLSSIAYMILLLVIKYCVIAKYIR